MHVDLLAEIRKLNQRDPLLFYRKIPKDRAERYTKRGSTSFAYSESDEPLYSSPIWPQSRCMLTSTRSRSRRKFIGAVPS